MAAERTTAHTAGQLGLGLSGHVEAMGIECRGFFSSIYLRKILPSQSDYPTVAETQPFYEAVKARWLKHWLGMARQNEDYTRTQFLDPLLKELGWHFIPEKNLPNGPSGLRKRPDYCLCRDEAAVTAAETLAAFCRTAKDTLVAGAPAYLRPDAQEQLLATPESCLAVIELTVNWEAEKLYGVEGLGPFDEF